MSDQARLLPDVLEPKVAVLRTVSDWLDSACTPNSSDLRLVIEKSAHVRAATGKEIVAIAFTIKADTGVGVFEVPISRIVKPTDH